jgi:hypothetical protein
VDLSFFRADTGYIYDSLGKDRAMTIDICSQDFFIYVPDQKKIYETLPLLDVSQCPGNNLLHTQNPVDEHWVKIPLQDRLVVYARLGIDAEA